MVNITGNLNVVEDYRRVHEAFERINFNAFDFDTIKASLIEYLRLYFPEDFNDYIESSEIISIIETFAYVGELIAYRLDLNAHELNLDQAEKKESILRLARLISFSASRRQSARGLVKIEAVSTTEEIRDSLNNNLRNRTIRYNDPNNINWQEQFFTVIQAILNQNFGEPQKSEIIDGITFERYSTKISDLEKGIFPYTVSTTVKNVQMELVSTDIETSGAKEAVPNPDGDFLILFVNDGLGFGSTGTGFQILTVQGEIVKNSFNFEQPIPNRAVELPQQGLNEADVHVLQVGTVSEDNIVATWSKVDTVQGDTLHFNPGTAREIYEVVSLNEDRIQINFGDAPFGTIPVGPFNIWVRISEEEPVVIPRNRIQDEEFSFNYTDTEGNPQQGTFRFSLPESIANAVASQDIEDIRRIAPSIYYTQNRMVNSRDYNEFLFQDPAVLKLKSVVRTFSGQTKFQKFQDSSGNFQNIKIFGDDVRFYLNEDVDATIFSSSQGATDNQIITTLIEPILTETAVKEHLERVQGVSNPRTQLRESINVSAQFSFDVVRVQGSNTGASGAAASTLIWRFGVDGSVGTITPSNAAFFVRDGVSISSGDFTIVDASNVDINSSAGTGSVFIAASIGNIPFSSTNFIPYPQRGHDQEKTDIQGRVDGRYFGTVGSAIGAYSADGLIRTVQNKNVYILDINIPASAYQNGSGITASSFVNGATVGGSALGTTATVEAVYPVPNASGVSSSVFGVGAILYLTASSTATASYNHGETITLTVSGSTLTGSGATTAIGRIISGSVADATNDVHTYQFQAGGASSVGASSVGQHEETASNIVSITGATSNNAFGIGYDKILDHFYTIAPADLGSENALWSDSNARSITGSSLDDSWLIRVQPIRSGGATSWKVSKRIAEIAVQGITTDFFYQNNRQLENPDTGLIVEDTVTALGINFNVRNDAAIGSNLIFPVVRQPVDSITSRSDRDLLIVKEKDTNQDGVPDNTLQFEALIDRVSNRLTLSPVGDGNDLTASPPEQQKARDGATVFGVPRHIFRFSDGDVRWQEQTNRWSRGSFVQEFVDQSAYLTASNTSGSSYDYTYTFPIGGSLMGAAPDSPFVLAGSTAAAASTLVELVRGSDYTITGSDLNKLTLASASSLFTTLGGSAQNGIIQVKQRGITTSVVDNLQMASNTDLNTTGDVPFTIESWINANQTHVSSFVVYDQSENLDASSAGFKLFVENNTIVFEIGGSAASGSDLLTASVTTTTLLDGTFHHVAGVYTIGMTITNSALADLSVVKEGDRLVNTTNSSLATIYDLETIDTSNAVLWVRDIVDNQTASSTLFGFESGDTIRLETLQPDGSFSSLDAASSLVSSSNMGSYIRAFVDGSAGVAVSSSALGIKDINSSNIVGMMRGVFASASAPRPAVYFDGISLSREARYGGIYTPGRIQPQTVFFSRTSVLEDFDPVITLPTPGNLNTDQDSLSPGSRLFRERIGRDDINFLWAHFTPRSNLIDPSKTNIIDMFIHTAGYQTELESWIIRDILAEKQPNPPTPTDLRIAFGSFLDKAMLSDTVILHPGRVKFLFGRKSPEGLRAKFRIVKRTESLVADDHLRALVLEVIQDFFDIESWDFGRIFYATELYAQIHTRLPKDVQSVVLVPSAADDRFGDLHQIEPEGDEILQSAARGADIEIIEDITRTNIRRVES